MNIAIVTTTIHKPVLLEDYAKNAKEYGHEKVSFIVIGDKKTPPEVNEFCQDLTKKFGYRVDYYDVQAQVELLKDFPALAEHLPYNSIQRRNIGILQAYREDADVIITIDDDNFLLADQDFIGMHAAVGQVKSFVEITSDSKWYNVCELLEEKHGLPFYHRGYPLPERWKDPKITSKNMHGKVAVNAGLWLEAPDIDALTWLDLPIETTSYKGVYPDGVGLAVGTWSPFNSQNTSLAREVIPAYFLSPYIGRYDDIWASYIVKKISDHLNDVIHFGFPLVQQKRNPHNYFKDFDKERLGMELTPQFMHWIMGLQLQKKSYAECFAEITEDLEKNWKTYFEQSGDEHVSSLESFVKGLRIWVDVYAELEKKK